MYGHHDYSLNLEIVQTKRDKEVRTKISHILYIRGIPHIS